MEVSSSSSGENDNCSSDAELQRANIVRMVKEKDVNSLQRFGGILGIAEALDTDLENGIPGHEEDLRSRRIASTLSPTQAPIHSIFQILRRSCNSYVIFFLFASAMLSLGFGIKEEGSRTGWYEGVIILLAIIIHVVVPVLHDFRLKYSRKMSRNDRTLEMCQIDVDVLRGGCVQKVSICNVLLGDIVCLKSESLVPADGLFISGESLKLDDELQTIVNEESPFLFYGAKVIDGTGRMLVTSVGKDTTWGCLMKQVTHAPYKTPLATELDKVNTGIQIIGLSISILLLVVLFLRFTLEQEHVDSSLPDMKGKPTASKDFINAIKKIVMKPNGKVSTLTTSLTWLLVGVMEGIPFVISVAIFYWNKKLLSDKAVAQEPLACLAMASVTTICLDKIGWTTLMNPLAVDMCCAEMRKATETWRNAGLNIILVSEDNVSALEAIALEYEMLPNSNRLVVDGKTFRDYSNEERMNIVDKVIAMGSSFPSDKLLLVQCLKKKGHRVAMVGLKTNEIPVLKEADVGIVIGACSSEMARESSEIIIRDGNFNVLVTVIRCGKCTFENIQKYIQMVLTMNIAGLLIPLVTTISFRNPPITAIQLLWTNFMVALLGGLALLTEPSMENLMDKPPLRQTTPLITKGMWRNHVTQVLYQVVILVAFQFKGQAIMHISKEVSETIIFNSFVLCQVFNQVNARELERKNVLRGIHRNPLFWVGVGATLGVQVAFIEIAHIVTSGAKLNWAQWLVCLLIGVVSCTIDLATKCTSECVVDWLVAHHMGSSVPSSASSESTPNLELPLIREKSIPIPS